MKSKKRTTPSAREPVGAEAVSVGGRAERADVERRAPPMLADVTVTAVVPPPRAALDDVTVKKTKERRR